jgi:hypothetical protein
VQLERRRFDGAHEAMDDNAQAGPRGRAATRARHRPRPPFCPTRPSPLGRLRRRLGCVRAAAALHVTSVLERASTASPCRGFPRP